MSAISKAWVTVSSVEARTSTPCGTTTCAPARHNRTTHRAWAGWLASSRVAFVERQVASTGREAGLHVCGVNCTYGMDAASPALKCTAEQSSAPATACNAPQGLQHPAGLPPVLTPPPLCAAPQSQTAALGMPAQSNLHGAGGTPAAAPAAHSMDMQQAGLTSEAGRCQAMCRTSRLSEAGQPSWVDGGDCMLHQPRKRTSLRTSLEPPGMLPAAPSRYATPASRETVGRHTHAHRCWLPEL